MRIGACKYSAVNVESKPLTWVVYVSKTVHS